MKNNVCGYKFELVSEFEIRIEAPDGTAWRIRNEVDDEYGFQKFLWDMAETMTKVREGEV